MGRLFAILLGGAALAFYVPVLLPTELEPVLNLWKSLLGPKYDAVTAAGGGLFAGLGLILLAVRGKDGS